MRKRYGTNRWIGAVLLIGLLGLTGCTKALETASTTFDSLVEDLLFAGQDSYSDTGKVLVRILTPTPIPEITETVIPEETPTPLPDDVEPASETVDELVYAISSVNIRAGWSVDFSILGSLQEHDQIHRVAILENGWSKVAYNGEYAYINSSYLTTERPNVVGTVHLDTKTYMYEALQKKEDVMLLGVQNIMQKPDLPAGPEITCLAIVLNYLGEYADNVFLAENYLITAQPGEASPYEAYLGNPKVSDGSYGCYAPVIVNAANRYFENKGITKKKAKDVSQSTMEQLFDYIDDGNPVIVWGTTNMTASKNSTVWEIDGEVIQWKSPEHCTVLIGYNRSRSTVIVADPLRGIVEYDMEKYYKRYTEQYSNAVVIVTP